MDTKNFVDHYFDIAMKIHAFCFDQSISKDDAKLYVYIYVKATESMDGTAYFEQDCSAEIMALKSLLDHSNSDAIVCEEPLTPEILQELYEAYVNRSLRKIERDIQMEYGIETVFQSELLNRLRLHTDEHFRRKHIDIFTNTILPGLLDYTEQKVKLSNINYQLKLAHEENTFNLLMNE